MTSGDTSDGVSDLATNLVAGLKMNMARERLNGFSMENSMPAKTASIDTWLIKQIEQQ